MNRLRGFGFSLLLLASTAAPTLLPKLAHAQLDEPVDPRAEKVLSDFLAALTANEASIDAAIKAALPYLHKSLLGPGGSDVSADLRRFSFKKAWENAKFYAQPVKITRVRKTSTTAIGFNGSGFGSGASSARLTNRHVPGLLPSAPRCFPATARMIHSSPVASRRMILVL